MKKKILIILLVLLVASIASSGYFFWQWRTLKNDPASVAQDENKKLIKTISKLMLLPEEEPTIATVTDPEKLSDQTFFANAKAGYKVLVYSQSKKAILYDPASNRIIEVGPVNITEDKGTPGDTPTGTTTKDAAKE